MTARLPDRTTKWATRSRRIGLFSLPILIIGVVGSRFDYFGELETFAIIGVGFLCALLGLVFAAAAIGEIWSEGARGLASALAGLVFSTLGFAPAVLLALAIVIYPPATDISSDIIEPPIISVVQQGDVARIARGAAGGVIIEDLYGIALEKPVEEVYAIVKALVGARGWSVVRDVPPGEGRIAAVEVVTRSPILRLRDRATIRLTRLSLGTLVDIRSMTLRGRHDFGANLRRITNFYEDFAAALEGRDLPLGADEEAGRAPAD